MATVGRAHGFRFVIFTNDHSPPHVHVVGPGGEAKIVLEADGGVRPDWSAGISAGDLRRLLLAAPAEREHFLAEWRRIHG